MMRGLMIIAIVVSSVGFLLSMSHPVAFASMKGALIRATDQTLNAKPARAVEIARSDSGEFSLRAKINGVSTPMVIDTGATSVVLTYETAKAAGLPLELLDYSVDVETAGGRVRARG